MCSGFSEFDSNVRSNAPTGYVHGYYVDNSIEYHRWFYAKRTTYANDGHSLNNYSAKYYWHNHSFVKPKQLYS